MENRESRKKEGIFTDTLLSPEKLRAIYDGSIRQVTERSAGILLDRGLVSPDRELCTVYTGFERGAHTGLALCAEHQLFARLTRQTLRREHPDAQLIEAFAKEYFNEICGHIAAALFRESKTAVRFQIPAFYHGRYHPGDRQERWDLQYLSDLGEGARLIHYSAPLPEG